MEISESMDFADPQDPKPAPQPFAPQPVPVQQEVPTFGQEPLPVTQLFSTEQIGSALAQQYTASFDAQQQMMMQGFRQAIQTNPDMYAKQQNLAAQLGLDPKDQNRDWQFVEKFAQQQAAEQQAFNQQYPILAASMRQFDFAAVSHDDLQALQKIEGLWDFMGAKWELGTLMVERGEIGSKMAAGWADEEDLKRLKEIDRQMQSVPQPSGVLQSLLGGSSEVLGQMVKTVPTSIIAGGATSRLGTLGGPLAKLGTFAVGFGTAQFAQSAIIEGGNAYADYIEQGYSEESARTAAFGVGILNGALETAGLKFASAPLRKVFSKQVTEGFADRAGQSAFWNAVKGYGKAIGGEVATEMAQEISTITGGELAKLYSRPELDSKFGSMRGIGEITTQVMEIAQKTLESMILLGAPGSVGVYMNDSKRIDQAQATHEVLSATVKGAVESKLLERAPGALRSLLDNTIGPSMPELYVEGADMKAALERHAKAQTEAGNIHQKSALIQMEELFPGFTQRMEESIANGTPMQFSTAEFATKLGKTDFIQDLLLDMRGDPNGLSQREATKWYPELKNLSGQMQEAISQKAVDDKAFRDSMRKVRDEVLVNVRAQGVKDAQARVAVNLYTARIALAATRDNVSPEEYHRKHGVRTQADAQPSLRPVPMPPTMERILSPVAPQPAPAAPAPAPAAPVTQTPNEILSNDEIDALLQMFPNDVAALEASGEPRRPAPAQEMAPAASEAAIAPAEAMAPEVAPAPAPAEAAAPAMTPEQEQQRIQLATAYAELFDPASTMPNEQKIAMVEELLTDPRVQLTEEEQAPLMEWLSQAQQVVAPTLPIEPDPTLPTPQEVGEMVEEIVQLEQQIQQAEAQPEAAVEPVAEAQPMAEVAPAVEAAPAVKAEPLANAGIWVRKPGLEAYDAVPGRGNPNSLGTGYISGKHNDAIAARAQERGDIGLLVTPLLPNYVNHAAKYPFVAVDNGVFSKAKPFAPEKFKQLATKIASDQAIKPKVLFVVAPDVVGDAAATLKQFTEWANWLKSQGLPVALAAQDGLENMMDQIPWDLVDVLFIGGSTEWKTGKFATTQEEQKWGRLWAEASDRGIPIHMGRVNTNERIAGVAQNVGSSTVDGTYLAFGPDKNLPKLEKMLDALNVKSLDLDAQKYPELGRAPTEQEIYDLAFDEQIESKSDLGAYEPAAQLVNAIRIAMGLEALQGRKDSKPASKVSTEPMAEPAPMPEQPAAAVNPERAKKQKQQLEKKLQDVVPPDGLTELQRAARALLAGEMTRDQWEQLIAQQLPIRRMQKVPELSTMDSIHGAVRSNQKPVVMPAEQVGRDGQKVMLRTDIPAKQNHGVDVVSVHEWKSQRAAGKVIGFTNAMVIDNVEFGVDETKAKYVATKTGPKGGRKDWLGTANGNKVQMSAQEAKALAEQAFNDPSWVQVGMNPALHSYFYDRATGQPIVAADRVIQVGTLLLAKNAVTAPREQFLFSRTQASVAQMDADYLAAVERGDMETAQRMVDEAAKANGYNETGEHGLAFGELKGDSFDPSMRGANTNAASAKVGFFFGSNKTARAYGQKTLRPESAEDVSAATQSAFANIFNLVPSGISRRLDFERDIGTGAFAPDSMDESDPDAFIERIYAYANNILDDVEFQADELSNEADVLQAVEQARKQLEASVGMMDLESVTDVATVRVKLLMQNPLVHDQQGQKYRDRTYYDIIKEAQARGNDSVIIKNTYDGGSLDDIKVVFAPEQIKSADPVTRDASGNVIPLSQRFDLTKDSILYSQSESDIGGRYDRQQRTIELTAAVLQNPEATFTTWVHELMHWMFDDLSAAVADGRATPQDREQLETMVRWASKGKMSADEFLALPPEQQREIHETVAYGWEAYHFEGADPGVEYRGMMRKIRDWFIAAYKSLTTINDRYKRETGQDLPGLTPEVKLAFSRFIGTENQVQMAKASRSAVAMFQTKDEFIAAGNQEDEWDGYQTLQRERDQQWIDELLSESIQQLKWQATSRDRNIKRLQQDTEGVREELRKEVRPSVQAMPIIRARKFLLTGERRDENGNLTAGAGASPVRKLNRKEVLGNYDAENAVLGELDARVMDAKNAIAQAEGMHIPVVPEFKEEPPTKLPETATKEEKKAYRAALAAYNDRQREAMVIKKEAINARREAIAKQEEALKPALARLKEAEAAVKQAEARFQRKENARAEDHPLGKYTQEDGMPVSEAAKIFGYDSSQAFLTDLQKKPTEDEMVEMMASRRMQEEYGDLTDKKSMEESVDRAMVNAFQIQWASREYQFLLRRSRTANNTPEGLASQKDAKDALIDLDNEIEQKRAARKVAKDNGDEQLVQRYDQDLKQLEQDRKDLELEKQGTLGQRVLIHAARMAAQQTLDNTKVKDISPSLYAAAARRNSQDALGAVTKANWQGALDAKRKQMGNEAKAYEAARIRMEVKSALRFFKRVLKGTDKQLGDKRNLDFVYAARAVLLAFKVTSTSAQAERIKAMFDEYMVKLERYLPDQALKIKELIAIATVQGKSYKDLTYQEFRNLTGEVRKLWEHSENVRAVEINNKRYKVSEIAAQVQKTASKLAPTGDRPGTRKAITPMQALGARINNLVALMRRTESVFDEWDGRQPGVFTKLFWRPIQQAVTAYRKARIAYYQKYAVLVANMTWDTKPINAPEIKYEFKNKAELVAALLHTGNLSNLAKLLRGGRGANDAWGEVRDDNTLDDSRWQAMVDRLCEEGVITEQDLNFVQSVWDLMDELKPEMQLVHRRLEGRFFNEQVLQARTYTLKDGTKKTLRGGYVPAKPDRELAIDYRKKESVEEVMQDFRYSLPRTEMGMTKDRVEGFNKPLQLDLAIIGRHIDDATKFIHVQPAIANILTLVNNQEILTSINEIDGAALDNIIMPWLNRVASQRPGMPGVDSSLDKILNAGRNRAGMAIMFLNLSNAAQQITGIIPAALKVPPSYLLGSLRRYFSRQGYSVMQAAIAAKSEYMRNRMEKQIFEVVSETNDLIVNPSRYEKAQKWAQKNAYILQQKAQNIVDAVVWEASYNHAIATLPKTMTAEEMEVEAVALADAAVRLTQGTTQPESVSSSEAQGPFLRLFTQFTSYFNTIANLNLSEFRKTLQESGGKSVVGKLFTTWMIGFAAPMLAASAISRAFAGKWDDEDDDGYGDEIGNWMLDGLVKGSFQMVPFGNALYSATLAPYTDTVYDDRMMTNPLFSLIERGAGAIKNAGKAAFDADLEMRGSTLKDIIAVSDLISGIPLTPLLRPVSYGYGVLQDQIDPYNAGDFVRGLVTGVPAEGTRNR